MASEQLESRQGTKQQTDNSQSLYLAQSHMSKEWFTFQDSYKDVPTNIRFPITDSKIWPVMFNLLSVTSKKGSDN